MGYGHHIGNIPFGCQLCASGRFSRMGRPRLERLAPPHALASSPSLSLFSFLFLTDFFRRRTRRTRGRSGRRAASLGGRGRRLPAARAAIPGAAVGESQWRRRMRAQRRRREASSTAALDATASPARAGDLFFPISLLFFFFFSMLICI